MAMGRRLSVSVALLLTAAGLSGAVALPAKEGDKPLLRKGNLARHRRAKASGLLSAEVLNDLYAAIQATNELNGLNDVEAANEATKDIAEATKVTPQVSEALSGLIDAASSEDPSAVIQELANTLDATLDYMESLSSDQLPSSMQDTLDTVVRRLRATKAQIDTSAARFKQLSSGLVEQEVMEVAVEPDVPFNHQTRFRRLRQEEFMEQPHRGNSDHFAKFRPTSSRYQQHLDISQAILNGDERYIKDMLTMMVAQTSMHEQVHGRRATVVSRREQCKQLVACAASMTIYDLILFFHSDDIDFTKGEFNDGDLITFDEDDIFGVASRIASKIAVAKGIGQGQLGPYTDSACDALLEEFHRTKELGDGLFAWQGGVVSEVCVASRSVEHVKLESIATTISKPAADLIFEDAILCSKQLFDAKDSRFASEMDFVFVDSGSNGLRLPKGIRNIEQESDNRNTHGRPDSVAPSAYFEFDDITADLSGLISDTSTYDWDVDNAPLAPNAQNLKDDCIALAETAITDAFLARPAGSSRLGDTSSTISFTVKCEDVDFECCAGDTPATVAGVTGCFEEVLGFQVPSGRRCKYHPCAFKAGGVQLKAWTDVDVQTCVLTDSPPFASCPFPSPTGPGPCTAGAGCTVLEAASPFKNTPADQFDSTLELVLGKRPSPGRLCAISSVVADSQANRTIGGTCCMDTPAESVDNWGQPYQCGAPSGCMRYAPYFAGISEEECDVYGGTYCPDPTNCAILQTCVARYIDEAQIENRTAYLRYLRSSPNVTDPNDAFLCGRAREYFGFEPNFPNDEAVCENVNELKTTQDFSILEEFASAGRNAPGGGGEGGGGGLPTRQPTARTTLDDPEPTSYTPEQALAWRASNFAIEQALNTLEGIYEALLLSKCPCSTGISIICTAVKNLGSNFAQLALILIEVSLEISIFVYGEEVGTNEQIDSEQWNTVQTIKPNLDKMLTVMYDETDDIDLTLADVQQTLADQFCTAGTSNPSDGISTCSIYKEVLCRQAERPKPGYGCDGIDNDCDYGNVVDDCDEDAFPPVIDFSSVEEHCGGIKHVFGSADEARACIEAHVEAKDDCEVVITEVANPVEATSNDLSLCGTMYHVHVTATESICKKQTSGEVAVLIDDNIPSYQRVCKLLQGPNEPPSLDVAKAIQLCSGKIFFSSLAEAEDCVRSNSKASDDCREVDMSLSTDDISGSIDALSNCTTTYAIAVTANIRGCSLVNSTDVVRVLVDGNVPPPSCNFDQGPDVPPRLDMAAAFALCSSKFFPTIDGAKTCVEDAAVAVDAAGGCRPIEKIVTADDITGTMSNCTDTYAITVTAAVVGCPLANTMEVVRVLVDENISPPSCSFDQGQGPNVPPRLDMAASFASCNGKIFPSDSEAKACVLNASVAIDVAGGGCRPIEKIVESVPVNNCEYEVKVTASIQDCAGDEFATTSDPVKVVIDNEAPVPSCEHGVGATIDGSGSGVLQDVGLAYTVTENCGGPVSVIVESFSNELDGSQKMALLYQSPGVGSKVGLFVATTICSGDSNGQCITDPGESGRRFYATRITATDEAGLTNSTECYVEVVGKKGDPPDPPAPGLSAQLFLLDSYSTKEYVPDGADEPLFVYDEMAPERKRGKRGWSGWEGGGVTSHGMGCSLGRQEVFESVTKYAGDRGPAPGVEDICFCDPVVSMQCCAP